MDRLDLSKFTELTKKLELATNEQTYLLSLWLLYLEKLTFGREDVTKDKAYALMSNMGQEAVPIAITTMEQEFPLLVYTHQLYNVVKN